MRDTTQTTRLLVFLLLLPTLALAASPPPEEEKSKPGVETGYGKDGFTLSTTDGRFALGIANRLQFRYTFDEDPDQDTSSFRIRRARLKLNGHGYRPWLRFAAEYDWPSSTMLDWRVSIEKFKAFRVRVGQWKAEYNRERVDSSGRQLLVDRSIVNAPFTLDRQIGVMLYGTLFADTLASTSWNAGFLTGTGLNQTSNDDAHHLFFGRLQWNFLGREVPFQQGDPGYTSKPLGAIAVVGATNRTNRTRFPQTSDLGEAGQFDIHQAGQDFVFRYAGFSFQQEFHWKQVRDRVAGTTSGMRGGYVQAGLLPHTLVDALPKPLELGARFAVVDPDVGREDDLLVEATAGANWYFAGHGNKLTADYSWLDDQANGRTHQVRVQWDVTF